MSCGVGHRHGLDLALLWLWCMPAATAPTRPLAWEPPGATGAALKKDQKKKKIRSFPSNFSNLAPCLALLAIRNMPSYNALSPSYTGLFPMH